MSFKKRVCNWLAAYVAQNGDPKIAGAFHGALRAIMVQGLPDGFKDVYEREMISIDDFYVDGREVLRVETERRIDRLNAWAFKVVDSGQMVPFEDATG